MNHKQEAVITISDGDLEFIVWQDKDRHQRFFKVEELNADDVMSFLSKLENHVVS